MDMVEVDNKPFKSGLPSRSRSQRESKGVKGQIWPPSTFADGRASEMLYIPISNVQDLTLKYSLGICHRKPLKYGCGGYHMASCRTENTILMH